MSCKKIISKLNAYADGEQSARQRCLIRAHLTACSACRSRLRDIEDLEAILTDSLPVPPVPSGLTARLMAAAETGEEIGAGIFWGPFPNPFIWLEEYSAAMRLAIGAVAVLAFVCGLSLNSGSNNAINPAGVNNLYGLEWFNANPPGSISAAYMNIQGNYSQGTESASLSPYSRTGGTLRRTMPRISGTL